MERITMYVDGVSYLLAPGQDRNTIKAAVVKAVRDGADIVTVAGDRELDVLVAPGISIILESETVPEDTRNDGDLDGPFHFPAFDGYLD